MDERAHGAEEPRRPGRPVRLLRWVEVPAGLDPGDVAMATVQTCVAHPVRNSLRFASRKYWKYWKPIADHLQRVYHAPTVKAVEQRLDEFAKEREPRSVSALVGPGMTAEVGPTCNSPGFLDGLIWPHLTAVPVCVRDRQEGPESGQEWNFLPTSVVMPESRGSPFGS